MKPVSLAQARTDVDNVGSARFEKDRVLHRALDEAYFRTSLMPGQGVLDGAATVVDATTFSWSFEDFPAAASARRRITVPRSALWPGCRVRLNLWYTSSVANAALFTVRYTVLQLGTGNDLGAIPAVLLTTFTAPGPAVANRVLFATCTSAPSVVLPFPEMIQFTVGRTAPDANPNAFRLLLAEFVLEEVA